MKYAPLFLALFMASVSHANDAFYDTVRALCGKSFQGEMTYPTEGQDSFRNKTLVAEVSECTDDAIKIPFKVGDDASRTWVLSKLGNQLQFKHDHRHKDGTPDEITNYGGMANVSGDQRSQSFPADEFTQALIPEAATNVWTLSFSEDLRTLTYHLERHGKPRFTAVLQSKQVAKSK